jgi:lactate dehydrogenase-like 2-hydroxyacid dehydrogenase
MNSGILGVGHIGKTLAQRLREVQALRGGAVKRAPMTAWLETEPFHQKARHRHSALTRGDVPGGQS